MTGETDEEHSGEIRNQELKRADAKVEGCRRFGRSIALHQQSNHLTGCAAVFQVDRADAVFVDESRGIDRGERDGGDECVAIPGRAIERNDERDEV